MSRETVEILGIPIDKVTLEQALARVEGFIAEGSPHLVVTPNAEILYRSLEDTELAQILRQADLATPDGAGVVLASRWLRDPVPERVTGVDLVRVLLERADKAGYRIYLLGAQPESVQEAARRLGEGFPGLTVCGFHHGYFGPSEESLIVDQIRAARPQVLLCGLGVPKQEKWLWRLRHELGVPVSLGIGGAIDVFAGKTERAPQWTQKANLEWLYRLYKQPGRIGRQLALPKFVWEVLRRGRRGRGKA